MRRARSTVRGSRFVHGGEGAPAPARREEADAPQVDRESSAYARVPLGPTWLPFGNPAEAWTRHHTRSDA